MKNQSLVKKLRTLNKGHRVLVRIGTKLLPITDVAVETTLGGERVITLHLGKTENDT